MSNIKAIAGVSKIVHQCQGGGDKKAGLGNHIGMGQFAYAAIKGGASGHKAPPSVTFNRVNRYYMSCANQLSRGGGPAVLSGMFGPSADGVNSVVCKRTCQPVPPYRFVSQKHAAGGSSGFPSGPHP